MKVLQWNMGFKTGTRAADGADLEFRLSVLATMLSQFKPSIIALQEIPPALRQEQQIFKGYQVGACDRGMLSAFLVRDWTLSSESYDGSINRHILRSTALYSSSGLFVDLINVHLPSRLRGVDAPRAELRLILKKLAEPNIALTDASRTIWIGDFNMDPWVEEISSPEFLCVNWCPDASREMARGMHDNPEPKFSPTWALLGKQGVPRGTYYYKNAYKEVAIVGGPWHLFDQIALPVGLADSRCKSMLVTSVKGQSLMRPDSPYIPDFNVGSDHFPIVTNVVF